MLTGRNALTSGGSSSVSECPFLRPSTVARDFIVTSYVSVVPMHWVSELRRAQLCGGSRCLLCREGARVEERYLIRLTDDLGYDYLLELRPRHRPVASVLAEVASRGFSSRVEIQKAGLALNSPVEIRVLGEVACGPLYDLTNLVRSAYLPASVVLGGTPSQGDEAPPALVRIEDTGSSFQAQLLRLREAKSHL